MTAFGFLTDIYKRFLSLYLEIPETDPDRVPCCPELNQVVQKDKILSH